MTGKAFGGCAVRCREDAGVSGSPHTRRVAGTRLSVELSFNILSPSYCALRVRTGVSRFQLKFG